MKKHIIITGASRGIGIETAKSLAKKKIHVTAIARSQNKLSQLAKEFPTFIHPLTLDITSQGSTSLIEEHIHQLGVNPDGIIHNAGLLINKQFSELTDADWSNQLQVNLMAPIKLTRDLLHLLKKHSHILNIGSMGGFQGSDKFPGLTGYSVTKGALSVLTECLSKELSLQQIQVNCLCLGAVQTEMLEEAFPGLKAPVSPQQMGNYIADFVLHGNQFYNGKILPVALNNPS